jgi:hypothetical protein
VIGLLVLTVYRVVILGAIWVVRMVAWATGTAIRWSVRAVAWRIALAHEGRRLRRAHRIRAARRAQLIAWVAAAAPIDIKGASRGTV